VFPVVKLTIISDDPIPRRYSSLPLDPVIIDEEEEWKIEKILDSYWYFKKYQYLIK